MSLEIVEMALPEFPVLDHEYDTINLEVCFCMGLISYLTYLCDLYGVDGWSR